MRPPNGYSARLSLVELSLALKHKVGVIRVIEDQIATLRPYNARYTGDPRSIFRKRYTEMITRVSPDLERSLAQRVAPHFADRDSR